MRLWSINFKYLDRQGLIACWREALLAQKVLVGKTVGYRHHPQLNRFWPHKSNIHFYLTYLYQEACSRGYNFDYSRVRKPRLPMKQLTVSLGQVNYEFMWLMCKLENRNPHLVKGIEHVVSNINDDSVSPLFKIDYTNDNLESWEIVSL